MEIVIGCDDGRKDMLRVAKLLEKYELRGTFYIAPNEMHMDLTVRDIKELSKRHEIGGHTLTHQRLTEVSIEQARYEITEGKKDLEAIIGRPITTFATPRGWYNPEIIEEIKKAGFTEHRTTKVGVTNLKDYDRFHLPCSAHMYPRAEYKGLGILEYVLYMYEKAKEGGYFNLFMHTKELNKYDLWEDLETIFKTISDDNKTAKTN